MPHPNRILSITTSVVNKYNHSNLLRSAPNIHRKVDDDNMSFCGWYSGEHYKDHFEEGKYSGVVITKPNFIRPETRNW